jgi:hypothetical protein
MDLNYELDENESNERLNMCLGTATLWTFQNKTNTENPETADSLNANDSADLHVTVLSTISKSFFSHCWELHSSIHKQLFGN